MLVAPRNNPDIILGDDTGLCQAIALALLYPRLHPIGALKLRGIIWSSGRAAVLPDHVCHGID